MKMDIDTALNILDAGTRSKDSTQMAIYTAALQFIVEEFSRLNKRNEELIESLVEAGKEGTAEKEVISEKGAK